jgi:aromatic-amino-acid transaminase
VTSPFADAQPYAGDPILSLFEAFKADPRGDKVNLGIGVYTDGGGRLPVLESVAEAQARIGFGPRPYLPMEGDAGYRAAVQRLVFGTEHPAIRDGRIATIQTLGGTGAVGIAADFLAKHTPGRRVFISDPTWENHFGLFQRAGFTTATYPYWDASTRGVAFDAMYAAFEAADPGSILVLQSVCHNPTGVDLDRAQEDALSELILAKSHLVVFDMAYQGFGEDLDHDAGFVRRFAKVAPCLVANSFSKIFSLYGERCGGLSVVAADADEAARVLGQLKLAVRRSYSNPPTTGALIVATVLGDDALRRRWEGEVAAMRDRMIAMRQRLADRVRALTNAADPTFITDQRGMFSYTGIDPAGCRSMRERDGIYLVETGRMCVAGLNDGNVDRVAAALAPMLARRA